MDCRKYSDRIHVDGFVTGSSGTGFGMNPREHCLQSRTQVCGRYSLSKEWCHEILAGIWRC